jgi:hypothetical protein
MRKNLVSFRLSTEGKAEAIVVQLPGGETLVGAIAPEPSR